MGFGSLIATALAVVVLLTAGYLLIDGIMHSADASVTGLRAAGDLKYQQLRTGLAIDQFAGNRTNGTLRFVLHNTGSETIQGISSLDIILGFTDANGSHRAATSVPCAGGAGAGSSDGGICWRAGAIGSPTGDAINPGLLDPGEQMTINVTEDGGFPADYGWALVAAPNGATASGSFAL